jgi:creatinine amidohydrolase
VHAKDKSNFVEYLSWDVVAARISNGASAILPIGAGAKQHGFHLPMNTDRIQAEALAARMANDVDALIWPVVTYGYYPAFTAYAGSSSLSAETFDKIIEELTMSLLNDGCGAIFVLDTGISTIAPVDRALSRIGGEKTLHLKIHEGRRYKLAVQQIVQQSHGSHADELETSLMLALAPDLVAMPRAEDSPEIKREVPGPLTPLDPSSPNFSPSGSFGDPTLATLAKGKILLEAMTGDLIEQARNFIAGTPVRAGHSGHTS